MTTDDQEVAARILACLDLTSLNDDDTAERIDTLCNRALDTSLPAQPAAVCVFPRFVRQAVGRLAASEVAVATVVNFPHGGTHWDAVIGETRKALADGADEIDFVIPWRGVLSRDTMVVKDLTEAVVAESHRRTTPALVKAIIETGALEDHHSITIGCNMVMEAGVDFIKTSTGKAAPGATIEAVDSILQAVVQHRRATGRAVGVKVSGGVRTLADAAAYLALADRYLAPELANPSNFRIGASSLYDELASVLGVKP